MGFTFALRKDLSEKCSKKKSWQILHEWVTNYFLHFANWETYCSKQRMAARWKWTDYCKLDAFYQMETNLREDNENSCLGSSQNAKGKTGRMAKNDGHLSDCQNLKNYVFRRSLRQHMSEKVCLWNYSLKWLGCYAAVVEQMKDRKCLWEVYKRVNLNEVISREQTDFQFFFLLTLLHFNLAPYSMGI